MKQLGLQRAVASFWEQLMTLLPERLVLAISVVLIQAGSMMMITLTSGKRFSAMTGQRVASGSLGTLRIGMQVSGS